MTTTVNLTVGKDWRSTLNAAFSILRRILFLTPKDFEFGNFDPQINWRGMTATGVFVRRARYLKIGKLLFVSFWIQATLGGALTTSIYVIPPGTGPTNPDTNATQGGLTYIFDNALNATGKWFFYTNFNIIEISRLDSASFTAGTTIFTLNTFLEIQ